jgi:hypothetical protein
MKEPPNLAETSPERAVGTRAAGYHGDDRWLLLWAALIGVLGALATVALAWHSPSVWPPAIPAA